MGSVKWQWYNGNPDPNDIDAGENPKSFRRHRYR